MVPAELATQITGKLTIPTIGIGAGPNCDAQVLVWQDMAGYDAGRTAKFVKRFGDVGANCAALQRNTPTRWRRDVPRRGALLLVGVRATGLGELGFALAEEGRDALATVGGDGTSRRSAGPRIPSALRARAVGGQQQLLDAPLEFLASWKRFGWPARRVCGQLSSGTTVVTSPHCESLRADRGRGW